MAIDPDRVLHDALQLSEHDRAALAGRLIESLDDIDEGDVAPHWAAEIEQRLREVDEGQVTPIPWHQARRIIHEN